MPSIHATQISFDYRVLAKHEFPQSLPATIPSLYLMPCPSMPAEENGDDFHARRMKMYLYLK
jgi:hypothetical protein